MEDLHIALSVAISRPWGLDESNITARLISRVLVIEVLCGTELTQALIYGIICECVGDVRCPAELSAASQYAWLAYQRWDHRRKAELNAACSDDPKTAPGEKTGFDPKTR